MGIKGVSVVIAAIIMFTFLMLAIIPLMLSLLKSGTQEPIAASVLASSKVRESTPSLNITLDYDNSNDTTRVYLIENIAAEEREATLLVVQDDNNAIYFVRPGACIQTSCSAGLALVKVSLIRGARGVNESIVLDPGGSYMVAITSGKLLGAYTGVSGYSPTRSSPTKIVEKALYAEVAGSVQTNFLNMTLFSSLEDLVNKDAGVILTTDPSSNNSDTSILYTGVMKALCGVQGVIEEGSFQPYSSGWLTYDGLLLYNLHPLYGSFVIGGLGGTYGSVYNTSFLATFGRIDLYDNSKPGIIAAFYNGYWFALIITRTGVVELKSSTLPSSLSNLMQFLESRVDTSTVYTKDKISSDTDNLPGTSIVVFDEAGYGLVMIAGEYVAYCTPDMFIVASEAPNYIVLRLTECPAVDIDQFTMGVVNATVVVDSYGYAVSKGGKGYYGYDESASISDGVYSEEYTLRSSTLTKSYTMARFKLVGETSTLTTYDDVTERTYNGVDAFGFYYYSGTVAYHGILVYGFRWAMAKMFYFSDGAGPGGIDPYFLFADTDGNGLQEMIFMTEDAEYGDSSSVNDITSGGYYGCLDWSVQPLYLKFIDEEYFVNGKEYAQVSIQVRYTFHDNAGSDTDEVDDPKEYIFSFQVVSLNGTIFMTADYIYQLLDDLEDTWPPNQNWVSESVFLLVPNKDEEYTIMFSFLDPYSYKTSWRGISGMDDVDFTVAIEWIGLWRLRR